MHLPRRRSGARLGDGLSAVVWSLAESWLVDGSGELPGAGSAGDGHACLPRALAVRVIHHDPAVSSDGGLLAQRARRRDACVETLVQQARTPIMSATHGHVSWSCAVPRIQSWLPRWCEHSVAIRVTSSEDLQLTSTRRALHRLLMICKAYDVVVDIWVSIPTTAAVDDLTVLRTPRGSGNFSAFSGGLA